ncbi:MAG: FRG domain-containing protein [Candidatus Nealsonbacteria bacterium]|nr:FRG domain-containing protein [Candidatus Nealsonbacteria bacterium]
MPVIKHFPEWVSFKAELDSYVRLSPGRRREFVFRGQADSRWELRASLDRNSTFTSEVDRESCLKALINCFTQEVSGVDASLSFKTETEWEMLGRHHGLPTSLLDWTQSPFVGAYFAFADSAPADAECASVWMFDRDMFATRVLPEIEVIDNEQLNRFNPRAIEQRGLFLQIKRAATSLEELLADHLVRYDIPLSERQFVLADLDEMLINSRKLFRDLDGAARSAMNRVLVLGETK